MFDLVQTYRFLVLWTMNIKSPPELIRFVEPFSNFGLGEYFEQDISHVTLWKRTGGVRHDNKLYRGAVRVC